MAHTVCMSVRLEGGQSGSGGGHGMYISISDGCSATHRYRHIHFWLVAIDGDRPSCFYAGKGECD